MPKKKTVKFYLCDEVYESASEDLLSDVIIGMCSEAELFGALILEKHPEVDLKIMESIIRQYVCDLFTCFLNQTIQLTREELTRLFGRSLNVLLSKLEPTIVQNILESPEKKMKVVH